jgi:hypothetical protein
MKDWTNVTDSNEVIELLKEREKIESQIRELDKNALIKYELERINETQEP